MSVAGEEWTAPPPVMVTARGWTGVLEKVAVTLLAWSMATLQAPVPLQAPDQPLNRDPGARKAVRVTTVPLLYDLVQGPDVQLTSGKGNEWTAPLPETETERG
jgi:hypothetical protein